MKNKDLILTMVSVVAGVGGIAYGFWQHEQLETERRHIQEQKDYWEQVRQTMRAVRYAIDRENKALAELTEQVKQLAA